MPTYKTYAILFLIYTCMGCQSKMEPNVMKITAHYRSGSKVFITTTNPITLGKDSLAVITLDSLGNGFAILNVPVVTFATLDVEGQNINLLLDAGYDLTVDVFDRPNDRVHFLGEGSAVNNYLAGWSELSEKIKSAGGKYIYDLDETGFSERLDSLSQRAADFHHAYVDSVSMSEETEQLLLKKNNIEVLELRQTYGWNLGLQRNFKIPDAFNLGNKIPRDSILLASRLTNYLHLLHANFFLQYLIPSPQDTLTLGEPSGKSLAIKDRIISTSYPRFMEEFLLAKNVNYWIVNRGITAPVESVYSSYKSEFPNSIYQSSLEENYNKWRALSAGEPAPNFSGITIQGEKITLASLRGKAIYVDVWATWCGPCVEEIPKLKEIQRKLTDENIEFLSLSIDQQREAWKEMINADKDRPGLHLWADFQGRQSILKSYQVAAIPRYILIDRDGNIIDANAPRPSQGRELEALIKSVLAEKTNVNGNRN